MLQIGGRETWMSTDQGSGTAVVVGVGAERGLGAALCRRFAVGDYDRPKAPASNAETPGGQTLSAC